MEPVNQRLRTAVEIILPTIQTLPWSEWSRLSGLIEQAYTSKAAKVTLDNSDVKILHRSIKVEVLGEPYGSSTI